ncbi:bidirectional sugar transporter SWEET6b-like [Triticum urartu]|uniref:bidirectional sugar transporter SWEET6b-like n=1 Tax=Triticum urartu TaxID=4572 RepID=UPI0020444935|nr:bidirectional sugar transporter SWEET6b-like [Triticum urartu]
METDGGGDTITRVVGWVFLFLGSLATGFLFYSPSNTIQAIKEAGDIGQQKADLYLAVLLNCLVWLLYGFVTDKDAWLVILINGVGVCFQLYYLYVFIRASIDRFTISCTVLLLLLIVASAAGIIFQSFPTNAERKTVLGRVGIVTGCIMYLGSARQLWAAICDNNVLEVMVLRVMLAALANGIFWTIYTGIIQDLYMGFPNWVGIGSAAIQLGVYAWFYDRRYRQGAAALDGRDE